MKFPRLLVVAMSIALGFFGSLAQAESAPATFKSTELKSDLVEAEARVA